jgi:hypothetical protein
MRRRVLATGVLAAMLALVGFAGTASASSNSTELYYFYGCTGTDVPSSFWGTKAALPTGGVSGASAFHVVGTNDIYAVLDFGGGFPPGIEGGAAAADDWCYVQFGGVGVRLVGGSYNPSA